MAQCAYCSQDRKLTREHIVPSFLYKRQSRATDDKYGWSDKAGKYIQGEHKIRDVCGDCNNGPLSKLDEYGSRFLKENGFDNELMLDKNFEIRYEYDLLLRWFLKLSFNAARSTDSQHHQID